MQETKCRIAPSLGEGFAGTPEQVWGTKPYNPETDSEKPCVFFGCYSLKDLSVIQNHKGKRWILWCGSDIRHLINGYWLDDVGDIKTPPSVSAEWISKNCESWVENGVEKDALLSVGIQSKVCPSFLGNVDDYQIEFTSSERARLYTSVSGDDIKLYGWDKIPKLALENPHIEFNLYGNTKEWKSPQKNVIVHGRVSQEQMNTEIKKMTGALRLTEFDGFSEILAKSVLWGQYPVSIIEYPGILPLKEIGIVHRFSTPNTQARNYYRSILNHFPWNQK